MRSLRAVGWSTLVAHGMVAEEPAIVIGLALLLTGLIVLRT